MGTAHPTRDGTWQGHGGPCPYDVYRIMLTRSCNIWSLVVIIFPFAWKPRWVMIMSVNCWARSTFDISSAPLAIDETVSRPE